MQSFDLEALIRAVVIGLSVAIIGRYIVHRATRNKTPEKESKGLVTLAWVAVFFLVAIGIYYAWPSLPIVPVLDKLSQAEAETLLLKHKLVPQSRPQMSIEVSAGLVVPHSQDPIAGITVHPGTVVSFGVATQSPIRLEHVGGASPVFFQPKSGEKLRCAMGGNGIYHCAVRGTAGFETGNSHVTLWLRPVNPPSDQFGWYLQRSGSGISRVNPDGSWTGVAQVGNAQYPPHQNDTVDLAVSVVDDGAFRELMGRNGVVVEPTPIGSRVDIVSNVVITLR